MNALLLIMSYGAFLIAIIGLWRPAEAICQRIYAWVPLPALIIGFASVLDGELGVSLFPNLLLGTQIGLDEVGRAFWILTAAVWLLAGLFSRHYFNNSDQERLFRFYFLATYSGTAGLTVAQDAPSFYAGYALMTIGGYGLIINTKTQASLVAGRVYIVVALIGEMLALGGIIIAASSASGFSMHEIAESIHNSQVGSWCFWLIFLGFGTKVGIVPLHFWLPRSYYWAPLPAVAVLSGAMTKAGVLGWLRFLPGFESQLASKIILAAGALMAYYGVVFGLTQTRAKTTLAFSSLSQMGYLTIAYATAVEPGASLRTSISAITAFALHHGLTKTSLFLGLGILAKTHRSSKRYWFALAGLVIGALALIGFPFTGGAYAKAVLKSAGATGGAWNSVSDPILIIGSIGTTLLMLRFIVLCFRGEKDQVPPAGAWLPWGASVFIVAFGAWLIPLLLEFLGLETRGPLSIADNLKTYLPIAIGSLVAALTTYKIWLKHSHLTPRPFDTILQRGYKSVWEDFPQELDHLIASGTHALIRFRADLRLARKGRRAVIFAQKLHTSWILGCTLFVMVGILIWTLLAGGAA